MKKLIAVLSVLLLAPAFAADMPAQPAAAPAKSSVHRYLVERTFPAGALDGLDAATKKKVNANNASVGRALGAVLRKCRQDEDLLRLRGPERGGHPQSSDAQCAARG
jgi:hypothetical protein